MERHLTSTAKFCITVTLLSWDIKISQNLNKNFKVHASLTVNKSLVCLSRSSPVYTHACLRVSHQTSSHCSLFGQCSSQYNSALPSRLRPFLLLFSADFYFDNQSF